MLYTQNQILSALSRPYVRPIEVWQQLGGNAVPSSYESLVNLEYAYTEAPAFYRMVEADAYGWTGGTVPTATEQLVPVANIDATTGAVEGTTAIKMPAVTTGAGNVTEGALAGRIPLGTMIGGIAIGAGIGIKEVAQHRTFWEDLGNSVIEASQQDPKKFLQNPFEAPFKVIWRALEDGSIQSYCDKRDAEKIIQALYKADAFTVADTIVSDITQPGTYTLNVNPLSEGYIRATLNAANFYTPNIASALGYFYSNFPNATCASISVYYTASGPATHQCIMQLIAYTYQSGRSFNVVRNTTTGHLQLSGNVVSIGRAYIVYDVSGAITNMYTMGSSSYNTVYIDGIWSDAHASGSNYVYEAMSSTVGTTYKDANPNTSYNGTDLLPPTDQDAFWSTFAAWLANGFTQRYYNPFNNAYEDVTYIPFTAPDINWQTDPISGSQPRVWTGQYEFVEPFTDPTTDPVNNPNPWIYPSIGQWQYPDLETPTPTPWDGLPKFPIPTPGSSGDSPELVAPTSGVTSGNKLYTVYNPTQAQVDALGGYLWTQNIIDIISQFFKNSPLEAIISLHMVYCTPTTGADKNIILGYLDSGVQAAVVTSQYETIECGEIDISEFYGNALDYAGVSIQIYLPFVGFRALRTKEIMGSRLRVIYKVDVYTGTCLAMIYAIRVNTTQLLYTYEGNCSVQIPLTASDRTRLISGLITAGLSAYTGNPAGVVGGIASIGSDIERSGGFSGNAGAMNIKKPYLIVTRAIDAQAAGYNSLYGYPLNKSGRLYNFRGYTRVESVHVDIPGATEYEKQYIENILKKGVVI